MVDGNMRAVIQPSAMGIEQALEIVNKRFAKVPLTVDDIYVSEGVLSSQALDSYYTRMGRTSMQNYGEDFNVGRPLMNSHRTGGWFGPAAELPIGQIIRAELRGGFLPDNAPYQAPGGAQLLINFYLQRGLKITEVGSDDLIKGITGGTIRDMSIGFSLDRQGMYRCSICDQDMRDWEGDCFHLPGVEYSQGIAFAWIEGAHGNEGSLVYAGANPEALIEKAKRMLASGKASRRQILGLEDQWNTRIIDRKTIPVPDKPKVREVRTMDWDRIIADIRVTDAALADELTAADEGARVGLIVTKLADAKRQAAALKPGADLGARYLKDTVDEAVKARVRVEKDGFDGELYRKHLTASGDLDYIKGEIASWERAAKSVFGNGERQIIERVERRAPASARQYAG